MARREGVRINDLAASNKVFEVVGSELKSQRKPNHILSLFWIERLQKQHTHHKCSSHPQPTPTLFHKSLLYASSSNPAAGFSGQAMIRALSTRRSHRGYDQLGKEQPLVGAEEAQLKRVKSLPAGVFGSSKKLAPESTSQPNPLSKQTKKASKSHPLFGLFYGRRKGKTTAKPEFSRYIEYVREGGVWDTNSNTPVIHFK